MLTTHLKKIDKEKFKKAFDIVKQNPDQYGQLYSFFQVADIWIKDISIPIREMIDRKILPKSKIETFKKGEYFESFIKSIDFIIKSHKFFEEYNYLCDENNHKEYFKEHIGDVAQTIMYKHGINRSRIPSKMNWFIACVMGSRLKDPNEPESLVNFILNYEELAPKMLETKADKISKRKNYLREYKRQKKQNTCNQKPVKKQADNKKSIRSKKTCEKEI